MIWVIIGIFYFFFSFLFAATVAWLTQYMKPWKGTLWTCLTFVFWPIVVPLYFITNRNK